MPNYKARSNWQLIEEYIAPGAESNHVFTFSAIDFKTISHLVLIFRGGSTAALAIKLQIEGDETSAYYQDGRSQIAGTEALIDLSAVDHVVLLSATLNDAASRAVFIECKICVPPSGLQYPSFQINAQSSGASQGHELTDAQLAVQKTSITTLKVFTSTSTWLVNTHISLYKVGQ